MKILLINEVCGYTSTGSICGEIADEMSGKGHDVKIAYGRYSYVPDKYQKYGIRIGNTWAVQLHALKTRFLDAQGFGSKNATKKFLKWADEFDPDLVWLHNLHGYYINIELLFHWLKSKPKLKVQWTLHDCWAFTGHCTYFTMAKCDKWKEQCKNCPQKREYPASIWIDMSEKNYLKKKELFCGINDMLIITPSKWLRNLVSQSFLQEYPIEIRYNKINKNIFKPIKSNFKEKYGLGEKKVILGVANTWEKRKGLDDFIVLSNMLEKKYTIVLVGLNRKQIRTIPKNIIGLERVGSPEELAEIYSAADIYINTSREETYGMTTAEALACGTKTIVYRGTAGEELVALSENGISVDSNVMSIYNTIKYGMIS